MEDFAEKNKLDRINKISRICFCFSQLSCLRLVESLRLGEMKVKNYNPPGGGG